MHLIAGCHATGVESRLGKLFNISFIPEKFTRHQVLPVPLPMQSLEDFGGIIGALGFYIHTAFMTLCVYSYVTNVGR